MPGNTGIFRFKDCTTVLLQTDRKTGHWVERSGGCSDSSARSPVSSCSANHCSQWSRIHGTAGSQKCRHQGEAFGIIPDSDRLYCRRFSVYYSGVLAPITILLQRAVVQKSFPLNGEQGHNIWWVKVTRTNQQLVFLPNIHFTSSS